MHRVRFLVRVGLEIGLFAVARWQPADRRSEYPKRVIAGSLGWRSWQTNRARVAQLAEHVLGKDEVIGSSPIAGSIRSQNLSQLEFAGKGSGRSSVEEVLLVIWLGVMAKAQ